MWPVLSAFHCKNEMPDEVNLREGQQLLRFQSLLCGFSESEIPQVTCVAVDKSAQHVASWKQGEGHR